MMILSGLMIPHEEDFVIRYESRQCMGAPTGTSVLWKRLLVSTVIAGIKSYSNGESSLIVAKVVFHPQETKYKKTRSTSKRMLVE
jgi:hypothetical protein